MKNLVALDLETYPNLTDEKLLQLESSKINKIISNKKYKETTKNSKIQELQNKFMEFRNGVENDITDEIIKEFSVNPLFNKIVAIGLTYYDVVNKKLINTGKCLPDEKELLNWFKKELITISSVTFEDITWGGHKVRDFDIPTLKLSVIRNKIKLTSDDYPIVTNRDTLFPNTKYCNYIIDTLDIFSSPLEDLSLAILDEGKVNDGSQVYKMFNNKEYDKIEYYVKDDSMKSYKIIKALEI